VVLAAKEATLAAWPPGLTKQVLLAWPPPMMLPPHELAPPLPACCNISRFRLLMLVELKLAM
jgi:hypothetical protein